MAKMKMTHVGPGNDPTRPPTVRKVKFQTKTSSNDYPVNDRWWLQDEAEIYHHVQGVLSALDNRQTSRTFANRRNLKLYSNFADVGVTGGVFSRMSAGSNGTNAYKFTLNVIESCVDTAAARIAKTRPLPEILTDGGTFKQQKKAKLLTKYIKGVINELEIYPLAQRCFIDACIFGTGALKLFIEDGQIKASRVMIDDIIVDEEDGRDGKPRQLHQRAYVNRDVLCELFPDHEEKIMLAGSMMPVTNPISTISQDLVAVTESWHLPSGTDAKDGLHVMCIDNCTLSSEEWEHEWFPFAFLRWKPRVLGFYGMGLAEQLCPIQIEISKIAIRIQQSIEQIARPNIFISAGANIVPQHISSMPGAVIRVNGSPQNSVYSMVPQAMSEEVYSWFDYLFKKAFEITGISQMSAASAKPAGLNSGAALRTFEDIESGRFELTAQRYEEFFCTASKIIFALSAQLFANGTKDLKIKVKDKKFLETINWKDAELATDEFTMEMFSVSSLPNSPGGRLQTVTELMQAGYFDKTRALELLNFPDVNEAIDLAGASLENAKMVVDRIRWDGKYTVPTSLMNLSACVEMAHNSYLEATLQDTPENHMEMLATFIADCQALIDKANAPPPGAPPADPNAPPADPNAPPPMANPQAPPKSDLLPQ